MENESLILVSIYIWQGGSPSVPIIHKSPTLGYIGSKRHQTYDTDGSIDEGTLHTFDDLCTAQEAYWQFTLDFVCGKFLEDENSKNRIAPPHQNSSIHFIAGGNLSYIDHNRRVKFNRDLAEKSRDILGQDKAISLIYKMDHQIFRFGFLIQTPLLSIVYEGSCVTVTFGGQMKGFYGNNQGSYSPIQFKYLNIK